MNAKEFFKRFHWGTAVPAVLFLAAAIAVMAAPAEGYLARSVTVGIFFLLAGGAGVLAFFLDREENPVRLLASVGKLSASLWMFITITTPYYIFCVAAAVIVLLQAGGDVFDAVKHDGGKRRIVRCVIDAVLLGLCIVVFCNPFPAADGLFLFTGGVMLFSALYAGVIVFLTGLFEEEEVLVFRPIKK